MRCENCRWRSVNPFVNPDRGTAEFHCVTYACQRRAPVATGGMHTPSITIWPMVTADHFCGEFTPNQELVRRMASEEGFKPCMDCFNGYCSMNCSSAPGYMKVYV